MESLLPAGGDIDHPELLGDKGEVDRLEGKVDQWTNLIFSEDLGRHPEAAGGLEGGDQLVPALGQDVLPPLHQRHGDIEGGQDRRGDEEPSSDILQCTRVH